ncbi:poly depolymerase [Lophiotrema nucula]|uniref:feruloyl esterase n=1 Tax=Lophiotrema nucula TaxID=690887 RepID=A0A6A5Z6I5_9PLEO|nr:poly depolymerase [Lophiotrema nucula]
MFPSLFLIPVILSLVRADSSHSCKRSNGCGKSLPDGVQLGHPKNLTIKSDSGSSPREYRIHVPESYETDDAVPLILSFHGRNKDMKFQEELSQFSNASYGFKGIAVYPQGVPSEKGTHQWQGDPDAPSSIDDVKFTLELLDYLEESYCIDSSRMYAAGKSNGGGFTGLLACDSTATKRVAAFAPVSGAFYLEEDTQALPPCKPSTAREFVPIMEFHGWKDDTIEYLGGLNDRNNSNTTSIIEWVEDWAKRDGFDPKKPEITYLCSGVRNVTRYSWNDTVVHYNVSNLYHDWPSTFPNGDTNLTTCKEAEATSVILDWFSKWRL